MLVEVLSFQHCCLLCPLSSPPSLINVYCINTNVLFWMCFHHFVTLQNDILIGYLRGSVELGQCPCTQALCDMPYELLFLLLLLPE